ncbi:hypothetical protein ACFSTA_03735 [Ornithinibacillus salinisoli]|uniref:DUF4652 domain-containing protein n=1 Tax=Ornithinibacillus salinisoli TaxID=1848459 RepID=A0ABW4VYS5_9BACI
MKRIVLLIFIACLFVLSGCQQQPSEKVLRYQENSEIIGTEKDEIIGEISDTIYESIDRSNSGAEEVVLFPIDREGEDIILPEGRYMITGGQSGNVIVNDEHGVLLFHGILDQAYGVASVTVDVNGSHSVHVDGLEEASITPVTTQLSNQLSTGIWEVGKDIEEGDYSVMADSGYAFGDLQIFEEGESTKVYEIIDSSPDSKIKVHLQDGQKIKITGVSNLQFEPQS